ncbi:MAG: Gfo/Idh/MocA family oxidoreductase [Coxiellaceae bacterium]|jgi:UDP-N-acetyl-2-amino-2-deoxyglucuronate dehydrogenase|nr:Gfo/Idh/MocA family oxidoreductase [Coxiellaceae bacterium]
MNNNKQKTPCIIKDRKIKIALAGCGRIAYNHFEAIAKHHENLVLEGVCDMNQEALKKATEITGSKGYRYLEELLENSDADIISLCTPSGLHASQVCRIANAGRHIITEKPMATRWQDGLTMVKACDEAGVKLFVVKQNRMNATLRLLKRAIDNCRFGRIYLVNINVLWSRPQSYYDGADWRGTWEFDGGVLMNQASHYIDLLNWLFGPVESIQAMTATLARNIQTEDTGVLNVKWRSGTLGSVNVTTLVDKQNFEGSVTIIGEKGTVRIGGIAVNEIQHWEFRDKLPEDIDVQKVNYNTTSVYGFGHFRYYENIVEVLRGNAKPETDGREGLKSLEILIATYLSARDGCKISLPLEY